MSKLFKSKIIEFPSLLGKPVSDNCKVLVNDNFYIWSLKGNELDVFFNSSKIDSFSKYNNILWIDKEDYDLDVEEPICFAYDIERKTKIKEFEDITVGSSALFFDTTCVGVNSSKQFLFVLDLLSCTSIRKEGRFIYFTSDGKSIYLLRGFEHLVCFDLNLNEIWEKYLTKKCYFSSNKNLNYLINY